MRRIIALFPVLALALGAFAVAGAQSATPSVAGRAIDLIAVDGSTVGTATFADQRNGVILIDVEVVGLPPGEHGIHIHERGVCDRNADPPFASAGGHLNLNGAVHGGPPMIPGYEHLTPGTPPLLPVHALTETGDLGNIAVGADGSGRLRIASDRFAMNDLRRDDGASLVIDANRDDLFTGPDGNGGPGIACGVVFPPASEAAATPAA